MGYWKQWNIGKQTGKPYARRDFLYKADWKKAGNFQPA
jgi:hypothetical protein